MSNSMLPKIIARQQRRLNLEKKLEEDNKIKVIRTKSIEEVQKLMAPKPKEFVGISLRTRLTKSHKKLSEAANPRLL